MSPTKNCHKTDKSQSKKRRYLKRTSKGSKKFLLTVLIFFCILVGVLLIKTMLDGEAKAIENPRVASLAKVTIPKWIDQEIIPRKCDSRRGEYLEDINGIVIHYVGNPGTTAKQNRDYFANKGTEVNSHFLVGLDGEIIQCLPLEEKSSASNERNRDTISIEVCHRGEDGAFTPESYDAVIRLTAWLCEVSSLDETAVIRHYDVTGKECPIFYVKHPDEWEQLKTDVKNAISEQSK